MAGAQRARIALACALQKDIPQQRALARAGDDSRRRRELPPNCVVFSARLIAAAGTHSESICCQMIFNDGGQQLMWANRRAPQSRGGTPAQTPRPQLG